MVMAFDVLMEAISYFTIPKRIKWSQFLFMGKKTFPR